jgi:hypothetical protein
LLLDDLNLWCVGPLENILLVKSKLFKQSKKQPIASRIVQSFGRISRGMSDHGIVI